MQIHPSHVTEAEVVQRQHLGQDIRDEEWEGVYHVTPPPTVDHQLVLAGLIHFLRELFISRGGGTIVPECSVFREDAPRRDYRIPDVVFVAAGRENIIAPDGIRGGAPDAVFEIRSPRDDSYTKFGFYATLGVPEVVIVQPDARAAEVWKLAGPHYERVAADASGAVISRSLEVSFRTLPGTPPRLEIADLRDPSRRMNI
ncbi:MAG: hypothetical protein FD180_1843 [Planctomycetota bacterium]|nr:MAG: hypothetical protein FD180_1843 [Planctomycetota bacterium]